MADLAVLEKELADIKARNHRVEADKAWETSQFRVASLCVITYLVASLVMLVIGVTNPLVNALIPTLGFFLSTQTLPMLKRWWVKKYWR